MNHKRLRISLVLNSLIFLFTIIACYMMFTGFKFMHGHEIVLESTKLGMLRFFTVQSNVFMGLVSFIFIIKEIMILQGKRENITIVDSILKLMATCSVGLTFVVVFTYLGPITEYGLTSLLMNANLFFHLIIPLLSIITFTFFERNSFLSLKMSFFWTLTNFSIWDLLCNERFNSYKEWKSINRI